MMLMQYGYVEFGQGKACSGDPRIIVLLFAVHIKGLIVPTNLADNATSQYEGTAGRIYGVFDLNVARVC